MNAKEAFEATLNSNLLMARQAIQGQVMNQQFQIHGLWLFLEVIETLRSEGYAVSEGETDGYGKIACSVFWRQ